MTPGLVLRRLATADPEVFERAFAEIGWRKPAAQYRRYLAEQDAGDRHVIVAEIDGAFAGYVTLVFAPTYGPFRDAGLPEIQDLNVLPCFRRRGIGEALVAAAEDAAREVADRVGIGVGLGPDYGAAQGLYARRGYVPDGHGVAFRDRIVTPGESVVVGDDLVLHLTKDLR